MKFWKDMRAAFAPNEVAVSTRLNAVTSRGKIEVSEYSEFKEPQSPAIQKRFWSPDEVEGRHE